MRNETIKTLTDFARANSDVMLLTADLGFSVLEQFANVMPQQFLNVGVCEQAMVGIAAGLALSGRRVVVYSIANFATLRCLEQLRNDVCYHDLPVTVIAVGGGLAYGAQGYTHHGVEDLGIMAMMPNIVVVCPADPHEAESLLPQLLERGRPAYVRLGRAGEPRLHSAETEIQIGRAIELRKGNDIALLATGPLLGRALHAADLLVEAGVSCSVISFPTFHPLDEEMIEIVGRTHRAVLTIEEHIVDGGFGTRVAERLLRSGIAPRFETYGVTDELRRQVGNQDWLLGQLVSIKDRAAKLL